MAPAWFSSCQQDHLKKNSCASKIIVFAVTELLNTWFCYMDFYERRATLIYKHQEPGCDKPGSAGCLENLHCQFSYKCAVAVRNTCQPRCNQSLLYSKRLFCLVFCFVFERNKGYKV